MQLATGDRITEAKNLDKNPCRGHGKRNVGQRNGEERRFRCSEVLLTRVRLVGVEYLPSMHTLSTKIRAFFPLLSNVTRYPPFCRTLCYSSVTTTRKQ